MNKKTYELIEAHTNTKHDKYKTHPRSLNPNPPHPPFYPFFHLFFRPLPGKPVYLPTVHLHHHHHHHHRCSGGSAERPHRTRSPRSRCPGVWDGKRHEAPEGKILVRKRFSDGPMEVIVTSRSLGIVSPI